MRRSQIELAVAGCVERLVPVEKRVGEVASAVTTTGHNAGTFAASTKNADDDTG